MSPFGELAREIAPTDLEDENNWKRSPASVAEHLSMGKWTPYRHLEILNDAIVWAVQNEGRLIVEMPVRHGKSELCSRWTPVWFLENWPHLQIALASYEATWATNKFGRWVRNTIEQNERHLSVRLAPDLTGAGEWETTKGGGMFTTGVGGPLTGRDVHLGLIDDPFKNRDEANSEIIRQSKWEWFEDAMDTRIEPGGALIIVMARWHPDDIVGRLKSGEYVDDDDPEVEVDDWKIINMPALCKDEANDPLGRKEGEALWPEKWTKKRLLKKRAGSPRRWASLYQQDPRTEEGNVFNKEWFKITAAMPEKARKVRSWDLAATEKKKKGDPDYTCSGIIGEYKGRWYIELEDHFRGTPYAVRERVKQRAWQDGRRMHIVIPEDPGQAGKEQSENYRMEHLKGFTLHTPRISGSKETMADPVSNAAEAGNVFLVVHDGNKHLKNPFLNEAENFPDGTHDDFIDMVSLGFNELSGGSIPAERNVPKSTGDVENVWRVS